MKKYALLAFAMLTSVSAFAQEAVSTAASTTSDKGMLALGVAIALGLGAFGATSGQGKVGAAAMEGLGRNPQARNSMFVPMIVVLALIESLFILTFLIAFLLNNKI